VNDNQARRRINDDRRHLFGRDGRLMALLCECDRGDCTNTVIVTAEDFDARRPRPILHDAHRHPIR
jgi:hypothetical protein